MRDGGGEEPLGGVVAGLPPAVPAQRSGPGDLVGQALAHLAAGRRVLLAVRTAALAEDAVLALRAHPDLRGAAVAGPAQARGAHDLHRLVERARARLHRASAETTEQERRAVHGQAAVEDLRRRAAELRGLLDRARGSGVLGRVRGGLRGPDAYAGELRLLDLRLREQEQAAALAHERAVREAHRAEAARAEVERTEAGLAADPATLAAVLVVVGEPAQLPPALLADRVVLRD